MATNGTDGRVVSKEWRAGGGEVSMCGDDVDVEEEKMGEK
jgi:hypothetical protein